MTPEYAECRGHAYCERCQGDTFHQLVEHDKASMWRCTTCCAISRMVFNQPNCPNQCLADPDLSSAAPMSESQFHQWIESLPNVDGIPASDTKWTDL